MHRRGRSFEAENVVSSISDIAHGLTPHPRRSYRLSMDGHAVPKVLVVDDNEANRILVEETLRGENYEVSVAATGEEAIAIFERERHDLVLLDIRMPGLDGFATSAKLRELDGGAETPIVFLTALRDLETYDRALRHGADDFLTKPIRPTELVSRVQVLLRIRRLSTELQQQFGIIRNQRDDLLRLQLQKERLMAFVVHDLKNPINSIGLLASLLLRDRALSSGSKEHADSIRQEVRNLTRLVFNLLDISKGEEGELRPNRVPFELRQLIEEVVELSRARARDRKQQLETKIDLASPTISADADLLRRILENLLDNALRHTPAEGAVRVSAEEHDAEAVVIKVADTGSGIPEAMRERVFEKYAQLEQPGENDSRLGRGLGLVFCRMAAEAHGGSIWIEDNETGIVFCVRIPHGS